MASASHRKWLRQAVAAHNRGQQWGIFPKLMEPVDLKDIVEGDIIPFWVSRRHLTEGVRQIEAGLAAIAIASGTPHRRQVLPVELEAGSVGDSEAEAGSYAESSAGTEEDAEGSAGSECDAEAHHSRRWISSLVWDKSDVKTCFEDLIGNSEALLENQVGIEDFLLQLVGRLVDLASIVTAERKGLWGGQGPEVSSQAPSESAPQQQGDEARRDETALSPFGSPVKVVADPTASQGFDEVPMPDLAPLLEQGIPWEADLLEALASRPVIEDSSHKAKPMGNLTGWELDESAVWALQQVSPTDETAKGEDSPGASGVCSGSEVEGNEGAQKRKREPLQELTPDSNILEMQLVNEGSACKVPRLGDIVPLASLVTPFALHKQQIGDAVAHGWENAQQLGTPALAVPGGYRVTNTKIKRVTDIVQSVSTVLNGKKEEVIFFKALRADGKEVILQERDFRGKCADLLLDFYKKKNTQHSRRVGHNA